MCKLFKRDKTFEWINTCAKSVKWMEAKSLNHFFKNGTPILNKLIKAKTYTFYDGILCKMGSYGVIFQCLTLKCLVQGVGGITLMMCLVGNHHHIYINVKKLFIF
jgi:hypothetical protein